MSIIIAYLSKSSFNLLLQFGLPGGLILKLVGIGHSSWNVGRISSLAFSYFDTKTFSESKTKKMESAMTCHQCKLNKTKTET